MKGKRARFCGVGTINVVNGLSINGQVFILSRDNQSEAKYTLAPHKLIESPSLSETICLKEHTQGVKILRKGQQHKQSPFYNCPTLKKYRQYAGTILCVLHHKCLLILL